MIKLIISDLDNTLLNDHHEIDEGIFDVKKYLNDNNILFTISSGRNQCITYQVVKELNINCPYICDNGANIYQDNKLLMAKYIPSQYLKDLANILIQNNIAFFFFTKDNNYIYSSSIALEKKKKIFEENGSVFYHFDFDKFNDYQNCYKITFDPIKQDKIDYIIDYLKNKYSDISVMQSEGSICTITAENTSKGDGVKNLIDILNISPEEVMVFGDNYNDISMFEVAGMSVSMANSIDEIKKRTTFITSSNNENGVSSFLKSYFKI